jgi:hypothetical protein
MCSINILTVIIFSLFTGPALPAAEKDITGPLHVLAGSDDTIRENQILYNGRIWRNLYYMVHGDQFLFSKEFLPGSVTISRETFRNVKLKYDLLNDELLTPVDPGGILRLNKQLVDSFSLFFENKTFRFIKLQPDSLTDSKSYYNVLYKNKTGLYVKYSKKIDKLGDEGRYDKFYLITQLFLQKDNKLYSVTGKSDLLRILEEDKALVKNFIKKNNLDVSDKVPESFIPVLRYYDSLSQ